MVTKPRATQRTIMSTVPPTFLVAFSREYVVSNVMIPFGLFPLCSCYLTEPGSERSTPPAQAVEWPSAAQRPGKCEPARLEADWYRLRWCPRYRATGHHHKNKIPASRYCRPAAVCPGFASSRRVSFYLCCEPDLCRELCPGRVVQPVDS